ncbi:NAD dependent epimerase/dehydratase [Aspergillus uvarum CBS 121591]|uniref:NAD dependent epimerase/dehydratase n=1 Tax=Aspergillus uvarum CBS 121591 TaxID=1448315 RepID=A0A319C825_9EURO|nr:NAD dependent epimerase/dehydratase [Aspergillus uvarum CBS 121591]PYH80260.1 NAD dependent epimerase/dehydratase [Aspergillus uvarum CBS 121591]
MSPVGSGQHVLLTGANGFVASHILSILIERGYAITATVRSQKKADDILQTHPEWKGKVDFIVVADFTSEQPFDDLFQRVKTPLNYVIHTASPLRFQVDDIQKEMIEPAEKGTTEILKAASRYGGSSLKRFVLLGSAVSVLNSFEDLSKEEKPYTEKDWNPVTAEQAIERNDPVLGYNVSKTRAEAAAWGFVTKESPQFDLVVINPDVITGPMLHPISGPQSVNETNQFAIKSFIDGTHLQIEGVTFPFYHSVDVRDVAQSHVDALTNPAAAGQRILLISGLLSPQLVVNIIRKNFPALSDRVPAGDPSQTLPPGVHPTGWDMTVSLDILSKGSPQGRWNYIDLETSVTDTVKSMLEHKVL